MDILNTVAEWSMYGLKGIIGLLSVTGIIAIVGVAIAFIIVVISNAIFWPIYLTNRTKEQPQNTAIIE